MATYTYNGVTLQLAQTLEFRAEPEYDPSGTDMLWTKYTIRVRGFLAEGSSAFPLIGNNPTSAVTLANVKAALEVPRRGLAYNIGPTSIVSVPAGTTDAKLGPHPIPAVVTMPNTGAFLVECGCEVRIVDCANYCPPGSNRSPVISLRWTQTETFDKNWYSKLVTSGKLIVRADFRQSADLGRPLCTPALLDDYQRISSKYTISPDGLELDFAYEDQEFDRLPPLGCTTATGTYTVTSEFPGVKRVGSVRLILEAPKGTDRKVLLVRALQMAYSKLRADGYLTAVDGKPTPPIVWASVSEDLFVPRVEVTMNALMSLLTKNGLSKPADRVALAKEKVVRYERLLSIALTVTAGSVVIAPFSAGISLLAGPPAAASVAYYTAQLALARRELADLEAAVGGLIAAGLALVGGAITAAGIINGVAAPDIMPSVGKQTYGLLQPQVGIATPTRGRLSALLTAAFIDPCLCQSGGPGTSVDLIMTGGPPSFTTNPGMTPAPMPGAPTAPGDPAFGPAPGSTPGATPGTPPVSSLWTGTGGAVSGGSGGTNQNGSGPTNAPAEIVIGPTNPTAGQLAQVSAVIDEAPYNAYHLEKQLTFDTGRTQLPGTGVGAAGGVSKIVTAHGGRAQEITTWVASRAGTPPVLPPSESEDPNLVFLYGEVVAQDVQMTGDGAEPSYMVSGFYVRAVLNPVLYELIPGVAPYLSPQVEAAALVALQSWQAPGVETTSNVGRVGYDGSNPLVENGVVLDVLPEQAPNFDDGAFGPNANNTSGAYYQPPDNP